MTKSDILNNVKLNIDRTNLDNARLAQLSSMFDQAKEYCTREGVTFADSSGATYTIEEGGILEMYTAWLFRGRASNEGMPRHLRWALNNYIFAQRMT